MAVVGLLALWNDAMGLPGAVQDPGWRNGDRNGLNTQLISWTTPFGADGAVWGPNWHSGAGIGYYTRTS